MFHKSTGVGQPKQWLRICANCEYIFIDKTLFNKHTFISSKLFIIKKSMSCPKCGFAHYGAPMVYDGFFTAFYYYLKQNIKAFLRYIFIENVINKKDETDI